MWYTCNKHVVKALMSLSKKLKRNHQENEKNGEKIKNMED